MADRRRDATRTRPRSVASPGEVSPITAASQMMMSDLTNPPPILYESWQDEAWGFYENLGEFNRGVEWFSDALSRVRLTAAKISPGGDEPEPLDEGLAAELVAELAGGPSGQSQMLKSFAVQLAVSGEAYLVGRQANDDDLALGMLLDAEPDVYGNVWSVQPANTIRRSARTIKNFFGITARAWEVQVHDSRWVTLPPESLVCRVWDRHEHMPWRAISPARPALPIMREIDMYNRYIIATLISRVALNGILLIPDEVTLPVNPKYAQAADPFMAELIDIMKAAIRNPGSPASAAPVPLRVKSEYIEKFKHLTFMTPFDDKIFQARADAVKRLATSLNLPTEVLTGMGDVNHWCVDDQTEILTTRGWVKQDQLNIGDVVLTLNHKTGLSEWQPVQDIYRANVTDLEMIRMEGRNHSSVTTPNHRWPVQNDREGRVFKYTENLTRFDRITTGAVCADQPTEPKWSDAFVELVAWTWTEGHMTRAGRPAVCIAQSHTKNNDNVARIRNCLTTLFGPARESLRRLGNTPAWREKQLLNHSGTGGPITMFYLNAAASAEIAQVAPNKIVSLDFIRELTQAQLELFIHVSMLADGQHRLKRDIVQRNPRQLDALELAAILTGRMTVRGPDGNCERLGFWNQTKIVPVKAAMTAGSKRKMRITREKYTGVIWCPVTPNQTWLARRNGKVYYTGNTAWQLTEDAIKTHISPKVEVIARSLTVGYLYPMLKSVGEKTTTKDGDRIIVWYDTSELTQRPDRSEAAMRLREMMVISDTATRRETGFDEADAPTTDELEKMILMKLAVNPTTAGAALKELTGLELESPQPAPVAGVPSQPSGPAGDGSTDDESREESESGAPATGIPSTRNEAPPPPNEGLTSAGSLDFTTMTPSQAVEQLLQRIRSAQSVEDIVSSRDGG